MRIEKAIEILKLTPEYTGDGEPIGEVEARELGVEALKLIVSNRRYTPQPYNIKLPGETKD